MRFKVVKEYEGGGRQVCRNLDKGERSGRSRTPVDLIALFPDQKQMWLVQCKAKQEAPKDPSQLRAQFKELAELGGEYKVIPYAYMKKDGKYRFLRL